MTISYSGLMENIWEKTTAQKTLQKYLKKKYRKHFSIKVRFT